jgi:DNA-nicking Smr family endonuclease
MKRGRRTMITEEDRRLWDQVRRTATPLRPEAEPEPEPLPEPAPAPPASPKERRAAAASAAAPKPKPPPPAVSGIDRRTMTRLARGSAAIDARIDLHGMTQEAAHRRLLRFLEAARADGARIVLVITGKGAPGEVGFGEAGRGILRRAVPGWLRSPVFLPLVSGYENAGRRHGGEGALYVRLRRKIGGGSA